MSEPRIPKVIRISQVLVTLILFVIAIQSSIAGVRLSLGTGNDVLLYQKSYALVIGASDYSHWPDLPGVNNDVESVSAALKKHGFEVILLKDPTRTSFDFTMRDFIARYGQNRENRILVYYAGHGHTLTTGGGRQLGYLVPTDAMLPENGVGPFKSKAISMMEIEIYAKQMESKHALFLFDSCFSGTLFEVTRGVPAAISEKTSRPVRQFITAGSAEQVVPDKSIFREQFVSGLDGIADLNKDGYITGSELAGYLEENVINYSRRAQTPRYGKIRDPYLDKGDFVFESPKSAARQSNVNVESDQLSGDLKAIDLAAIELTYWQSIQRSPDLRAYKSYVNRYPDGSFVELAKLKINAMENVFSPYDGEWRAILECEETFNHDAYFDSTEAILKDGNLKIHRGVRGDDDYFVASGKLLNGNKIRISGQRYARTPRELREVDFSGGFTGEKYFQGSGSVGSRDCTLKLVR